MTSQRRHSKRLPQYTLAGQVRSAAQDYHNEHEWQRPCAVVAGLGLHGRCPTAEARIASLEDVSSRTDSVYRDATKKGRRFFLGATHGGFNLEMHETILGTGMESHPPHKHVHEEIILLVESPVEFHIEEKTETVTAGSVVYFGSNEIHNGRNAGKTPCRYYVLELRGDAA